MAMARGSKPGPEGRRLARRRSSVLPDGLGDCDGAAELAPIRSGTVDASTNECRRVPNSNASPLPVDRGGPTVMLIGLGAPASRCGLRGVHGVVLAMPVGVYVYVCN